jgi:hypothetical protein
MELTMSIKHGANSTFLGCIIIRFNCLLNLPFCKGDGITFVIIFCSYLARGPILQAWSIQ